MHKAIKGVLIGGAVGGGVAAFQASRQSPGTPADPLVGVVARGVAQGALVGGAVGFVVEVRTSRRVRVPARKVEPAGGLRGVGRRAKPVLASVVDELIELEETLRPAIVSTAGRAAAIVTDAVGDVVDGAEPHVRRVAERAADLTRPTAEVAADAARDAGARAEAAREAARQRAAGAADAARERGANAAGAARHRLTSARMR